MIIDRIILEEMPYDKAFDVDGNSQLCHATGEAVMFDFDNTYWNEYVDCNGEFHYGR